MVFASCSFCNASSTRSTLAMVQDPACQIVYATALHNGGCETQRQHKEICGMLGCLIKYNLWIEFGQSCCKTMNLGRWPACNQFIHLPKSQLRIPCWTPKCQIRFHAVVEIGLAAVIVGRPRVQADRSVGSVVNVVVCINLSTSLQANIHWPLKNITFSFVAPSSRSVHGVNVSRRPHPIALTTQSNGPMDHGLDKNTTSRN